MKEPIKMHVDFSLLHKTLLIIEMRSKIFKAKGGAVEWFQNSFEHFWHPFYGQGSRQIENCGWFLFYNNIGIFMSA